MTSNTKRKVKRTAEFKRDYKKAKKQGKDIDLLLQIIEKLANGKITGNVTSLLIGCLFIKKPIPPGWYFCWHVLHLIVI